MNLLDIICRSNHPLPWSEGENIPWNEPDFSGRMLKEHLTQKHNAASRRFEIIDKHIAWIHTDILNGRPTKILDLGCGPGLYSSRLSRLKHSCMGIDYSPASIRYARDQARQACLAITYLEQDIRTAEYGQGFGLVMLVYGEFNVFKPSDAVLVLDKIFAALEIGGILLLEIHPYKTIEQMGKQTPTWYTSESGLFSDQPYICLQESGWDNEQRVVNQRYYIIDATSGEVSRYAQSLQAYTDEQYRALLHQSGFREIEFNPGMGGMELDGGEGLAVILARKRIPSHDK